MRFDRKSLLVFFAILTLTLAASAQRRQRTITIPAGTRVTVRMIDSLSSDTAQQGQEFHGSLEYPISVDGRDVIPRGADVVGHVTEVHRGGRLSDPGYVTLELNSVGSGSQTTAVQTEAYQIKGESHTKSNVTKIGGGAALGAIIGGIAGGGRGAAIGAGAGAAAGTGVAVATGKKNATIDSEAVLNWTTAQDAIVGVGPTGGAPTNAGYDDRGYGSPRAFSNRDRNNIRACFNDRAQDLPPGLARRDTLPPGLDRQLQRDGSIPPGLERRVQELPEMCQQGLPQLPQDLDRVVYMRRVMLIDRSNRILDQFDIE
jgi:hypothetical protein